VKLRVVGQESTQDKPVKVKNELESDQKHTLTIDQADENADCSDRSFEAKEEAKKDMNADIHLDSGDECIQAQAKAKAKDVFELANDIPDDMDDDLSNDRIYEFDMKKVK
jgi:hypothetical protein